MSNILDVVMGQIARLPGRTPAIIIPASRTVSRRSKGKADHVRIGAPCPGKDGYALVLSERGKEYDDEREEWRIVFVIGAPRNDDEANAVARSMIDTWKKETEHMICLGPDDERMRAEHDAQATLRREISAALSAAIV